MTAIEIRPRFRKEIALSPELALERLRAALKEDGAPIKGLVVDHHVVLKIPQEEQHFWSPQLSLEVEAAEEGEGALIRGLYGPNPSVWLLFVFLYSAIGAISLFIAITGFSQLSLGMSAPALWGLPVAAGLAIFLYFSAKAGERLGREEMHRLQAFMDQALGEVPAPVKKPAG